MSRTLTALEKTALSSPRKRLAYLVTIDVPGDPIHFCSARYSLTVFGVTYLGRGWLMDMMLPREDASLAANKATLKISGLNAALIALSLNEDVEGYSCRIQLATFNPDTRQVIGVHLHTRRVIGQVKITPPTEQRQ